MRTHAQIAGAAVLQWVATQTQVLDASTITLWRDGADQGARALFIVVNEGSKRQQAAAGVGIFASDYLVLGSVDATVVGGTVYDRDVLIGTDVQTNETRAFVVTGEPKIDQGILLAPCTPTPMPQEAV